jgi:small-conductance mechanosensitive channel
MKNPEPQVVLEEFAADSLVFAIFFWIDLRVKPGGATVASDLRFMIERRLGEAGISLASPQQTFQLQADTPLRVQMDSGGLTEEQKPS